MRDFLEACNEIIVSFTGYSIPNEYRSYAIVAAFTLPWMIWLYFSIRRWRGDFRAISSEMQAATQLISVEMHQKLINQSRRMKRLHAKFEKVMSARFDVLNSSLQLNHMVKDQPQDTDIADGQTDTVQPTQTRLSMANAIRQAIVAKWLEGTTLRPRQGEPHIFEFRGHSPAGECHFILFQTPYRHALISDGRMPFTVEVWVDNYKKLNFEWDSLGNYQLRGFKRGEWFADIAEWSLVPISESEMRVA